jgi:imidazolonepropionase
LIDCHTHAVFAGSREREFVQRIEGRSYAEIAESGGGIRVTVDAVRAASCDELVELALPRLERMLRGGVTTVEVKSGYGLSVDDELKMLGAVKRLRALQPVELVATYLAAHTTPREFAGRADEYLDSVFDERVLGRIRDEKLAEFCDVFCERTAFDVEQSRRVLTLAKRFGLTPKLHADQITQMGATRLAAEVGAISADHLERIDEGGIEAMRRGGCVAVLLPACSFYLGVEQAPARRILDADLPVAVATDYNPGSSMVESLALTLGIACTQMRMTPTESVIAATANAAAAIDRHDRLGAIEVGMQADLIILDVPNHERFLYEIGRSCIRSVIKCGRVVSGL